MVQRIHVSLLSDSRLFRDAVSARLALEEEIALVGAASTVDGLLRIAQTQRIDVVLVHASMDPAEVAEFVWDVKPHLPAARVVALGIEQNESEIVNCIEAGAAAWLKHDTSYADLLQKIRAVSQGRTTCSPQVLRRVLRRISELAKTNPHSEECTPRPLTFREAEVARLMARGLVNKQIGRALGIRPLTVKNQVHNSLHKLQVKRRRDVTGQLGEYGPLGAG